MSNQQPVPARQQWLGVVQAAAAEFSAALPVSVDQTTMSRMMDRMVAAFRMMAARNSRIYECTPASVGRAMSLCALTQLNPGGARPQVYLIPRRNSFKRPDGSWGKRMELDWQISFQGYVTIANRAGMLVKAVNIYEGDEYEYEEGVTPRLTHKPKLGNRTFANLLASYAVFQPMNGPAVFALIDRSQILARREVSESWKRDQKGPWKDWPDEMAQKTAIIYAASRGIVPQEVGEVFEYAMSADSVLDLTRDEGAVDTAMLPDAGAAALPGPIAGGLDIPAEPPTARDVVEAATEPTPEPEPKKKAAPKAGPKAPEPEPEPDLGGVNKAPAADAPEEPERASVWAEIERLEEGLTDNDKRSVKASVKISRLRSDAKVAKLKRYLTALHEFHANLAEPGAEPEEEQLPPEPQVVPDVDTSDIDVELLKQVIKSWTPSLRAEVCETASVPYGGDFSMPMWDHIQGAALVRLAEAIDAKLEELEPEE